MPYIGNNHIAGDHTNNFKVLDDISSYTATFDGSATSVVDTTNNTIRVVEHRFIQGQRVTYTNGGGGNIGGLTTGTAYFVIFDSASTIKLATNASNAANSTAINLSAVGTGSSHTLNAAFDGVNTKFKLTHGSGTGARLNNATQINVAINNVVQRPNLDPNNFTDGFALEDNHKIVFQTAPTSEDIFWGSIIANTLTTFDISDHKIDTFTGDGSTTEFTLSHTPANNESLMVTINGVLQHPSNASTARAYTLIASIIQFTAAPGVGDEIQVRHIGFAGATTADVSGFYGRTGNVVLTSNDNITTGNINAATLTASSANFSGNVSIGGTLTYEDVTNIDSVGIITARNGIIVTGVSTFQDIDVDGHTNLDNVSVAGVTTFSDDVYFDGATANRDIIFDRSANTLQVKPNAILKIGQGSYSTNIYTNGTNTFFDHNQNSGIFFKTNIFQIYGTGTTSGNTYDGTTFRSMTGKVELGYEVPNGGATTLDNLVTSEKGITVGTGVTIERNGQASFAGIVTFTGDVDANDDVFVGGNFGVGTNSPNYKTVIQTSDTTAYSASTINANQFQLAISNSGANGVAGILLATEPSSGNGGHCGIRALSTGNGNSDLTFSTRGSSTSGERLRIDSGGRIGVGENSPGSYSSGAYNLVISAPSGSNSGITINSDSGGTDSGAIFFSHGTASGANGVGRIRYYHSDDHMDFYTANAERLRITSGGAVGINETAPSAMLHVENDNANSSTYYLNTDAAILVQNKNSNATAKTVIKLEGPAGSGDCALVYGAGSTNMIFADRQNERLRITSSGNVNIGGNFTQTTYKAQIQTGTNKFISFTNAAHDDLSDEGSGIIFSRQNDGSKELSGIFGHSNSGLGIAARGVITFHAGGSSNYGSAPERLRIDSSGKLFLHGNNATGTNNSTTRLPNGYTFNIAGSSSNDGISIVRYSSGYGAYGLNIGRSRSNTVGTNLAVVDGNELGHITFYGANGTDFSYAAQITAIVDGEVGTGGDTTDMPGALSFRTTADGSGGTTPTERLRIDSSGRLLLGTTTEGSAGADEFTINTASGHGGMTIRNDTSSNGNIWFSDGTSGAAEYAGYVQYAHNGDHMVFGTGGSEKLRIDSSGHVMIGTTTEGFASYGDQFTIANSGHCGMTIRSGTSSYGTIYFSDGDDGSADEVRGFIDYNHTTNKMQLGTNAATRLHIDSNGNLGLGIAAVPQDSGARTLHIHDTDTGNAARAAIRLTHGSSGSSASNGAFIGFDNNPDFYLYNMENGNIKFGTNGALRMMVSKNAGIIFGGGINEGVTEPFFVETGGTIRRRYNTTAGSGFHLTSGAIYPILGTGAFTNGGINLGGGSNRYQTIYAVSGSINTSDKNIKNTIVASDLGLDFVNKLKPVSYKFNEPYGNSGRTHYGLISQDVEILLSELGKTGKDFAGFCKDQDYETTKKSEGDEVTVKDTYNYSLRYEEFISPIIKAIQELTTKIETLEQENITLRARVTNLEGN